MKFCTKCGHEINDEAIICTSCGCAVTSTPSVTSTVAMATNTPEVKSTSSSTLPNVFNFVFSIITVFCVFFLALAFVEASITTTVSLSSYSSYSKYYDAYSYFHPDYDLSIVGTVFAFPSFSFGIVSFVLALVKKAKQRELFASITRMVIGLLLVIFSLYIVS